MENAEGGGKFKMILQAEVSSKKKDVPRRDKNGIAYHAGRGYLTTPTGVLEVWLQVYPGQGKDFLRVTMSEMPPRT